jgi:peptidoglycan/xylan/chitin deacetylase (PgdA/CDA1 family)
MKRAKHGILTISLDFELYWGLVNVKSLQEYQSNLQGTHEAIEKTLELFERYEIHATWAIVGFIFAKNKAELTAISPENKPNYLDENLNPYNYIKDNNSIDDDYHFAPHLVDKINKYSNQEIGTHTFSHYYCLENGQNIQEFKEDISAAINIAKTKDIAIESLVFPRNQWNDEYFSVLTAQGITSYRGNEQSWLYKAVNETGESKARRALRLMDSYINLSGSNSYTVDSISGLSPYNIPSSRFLRPVSRKLSVLEGLRKKRIINDLVYAAKNNEIFHLWWHPHNFGDDVEGNIKFLEDILNVYKEMNEKYVMKSLNMIDIIELVSNKK